MILSGLSGAARPPRPSCSRTSATRSSTTCPASSCRTWPSSVSSDRRRFARVAIVVDVRSGDATPGARGDARRAGGTRHRAADRVPRGPRRRPHPALQRDATPPPLSDHRGIASSIAEERRILDPVRGEADVIVDTSDLSLRQLRERLFAQLATTTRPDQLAVQLISFGYKFGVPLESDLVFDVRFIANPYYVPDLRPAPA